MDQKKGLFERIYEVVRMIPRGKVMTYGQVASAVGTKDARKVGFALHANPYPPSHKASEGRSEDEVPCHRVVNKEGKLAANFAFEGSAEQQRRLEVEGVVVSGAKVDLGIYGLNSLDGVSENES